MGFLCFSILLAWEWQGFRLRHACRQFLGNDQRQKKAKVVRDEEQRCSITMRDSWATRLLQSRFSPLLIVIFVYIVAVYDDRLG